MELAYRFSQTPRRRFSQIVNLRKPLHPDPPLPRTPRRRLSSAPPTRFAVLLAPGPSLLLIPDSPRRPQAPATSAVKRSRSSLVRAAGVAARLLPPEHVAASWSLARPPPSSRRTSSPSRKHRSARSRLHFSTCW
ncbi:uncharacterized protein LOC100274423 [Zea mays]|jgi:hypothetical protein|uniref:Uncharacterized protein n=1 Tax=Zea mays TaxID=4577 RepID=B4G0X0_MAIZE|nr:uncharacterized protein LOC100274423 [Zea mays]ACF88013.1 unknown [Zea mays]|eukprot:NP_001142254.1 uncharacterized protein LOC100274423 [Zea mays]